MTRRELAARMLESTCCGTLGRRLHTWKGVLALTWHRIGDGTGSPYDRNLWSATPEKFVRQVRTLKSHFDVITPADLPVVLQKGSGRYVLITLDDGYRDNFEAAFPILRDEGVPATFFVSTGFLDRPAPPWWDEIAWMVRTSRRTVLPASPWFPCPLSLREADRGATLHALVQAYKMQPGHKTAAFLDDLAEATGSGRCPVELFRDTWMTWDMVRALRRAGMCVGGHTAHHPVLARLSRAQQGAEVSECRRRLEEELGEPMHYFSYPVGQYDSFNYYTRECLKAQGVRLAFSFYGGFTRFGYCDPYNIPRASVESYFSASLFRSIVTFPQFFAPMRLETAKALARTPS